MGDAAAHDVPHDGPIFAAVGEVETCYETFGHPRQPTILLIMGLGFQLIRWPEEFCRLLAVEGFHVVRFDNRDAGCSTHLPGHHYTLEDVADDAAGLLEALGVRSAHVVGASLGGMIAQLLAIRHPDKVLSLTSMMSTTGRRGKGRTSLRVLRHLLTRPARTESAAIERRVRVFASVGSTGFEQDVDEIRRVTALALHRDPNGRAGRRRQHHAVRAAGDRTTALGGLSMPTLVIHGTEDRMCHPSGGQATAAAIPGAELILVPGLGHDLPPGAWPELIGAIVRNAHRAETPDEAQA
jgi:pimeloyl-ACP methyl ester carboxylesterase